MAKGKRHGLILRGETYGFRYKDADGQWREKSCCTANIAEAKNYKEEFERNLRQGTLPTDKAEWSVKQAATLWVEQHAAHLGPAKSKRNEQSLLNQLARRIGDVKLKAVTLDTLKTYQVRRSEEVGNRTVNLELRILVSVLKEANLWGKLKHYHPLKEKESEVGRALTAKQIARLEATAQTNPAWTVVYFAEVLAINTGMRSGEVKRLQLSDVILELRRLRIRREGTKTDSGARLIELNQAALEAATRLYQRAEMLGASEPEHYLLPADMSRHTLGSDPLRGRIGFDPTHHQETFHTAWRSLRKAAGLDGLRFHDLRHSFISMMAERNVPLAVVQSMVGHISPAITRLYTHISTQSARAAVELLNQPAFVDRFVDENGGQKILAGKLLN
jgi:integrase